MVKQVFHFILTTLLFFAFYGCIPVQPKGFDLKAASCPPEILSFNTKYWTYRRLLLQYFVRVGEEAGKSLVASQYAPSYMISWADATSISGWYLGVLASEYALLEKSGNKKDALVSEIYYALKAIQRVDMAAEDLYLNRYDPQKSSKRAENLNGFFVRDDVGSELKKSFQIPNISSDFIIGKTSSDHTIGEMSQDQFIHMLLGLRMIKFFVSPDESFKGENIHEIVDEITLNTATFIYNNNWMIINPITKEKVARGPDNRIFSYAMVKAYEKILREKMLEIRPKFYSKTVLNVFKISSMIPKSSNRTMFMILATIGNIWGSKKTERILLKYHKAWEKEFYPILHALLYDRKLKMNYNQINNLLASAPEKGTNTHDENGWFCYNRFTCNWSDGKKIPDKKSPKRYRPGLDFMILRNVALLYFNKENLAVKMPEDIEKKIYNR